MSKEGIDLVDVYVGGGEVLVGAARIARQARDEAEEMVQSHQAVLRQQELDRRHKSIEAQVAALQAEMESDEAKTQLDLLAQQRQDRKSADLRVTMARLRSADGTRGKRG